jgi:hypothetical protein
VVKEKVKVKQIKQIKQEINKKSSYNNGRMYDMFRRKRKFRCFFL